MRSLVGRSEDVARALAKLRSAAQRGQGAVLLVTGEAGIGKSALVDAVARQAEQMGFGVGIGRADEFAQLGPGAPLLLALRWGRTPLLSADVFDDLAAAANTPVWLIDRVGRLLEDRLRAGPVLLAIDDYQWCDEVTTAALRLLVDRLVGLPVVWVVAGRSTPSTLAAGLGVDAASGPSVEVLPLGPLEEAAVVEIVTEALGSRPSELVIDRLRGAAGNPLVALQFVAGNTADSGSLEAVTESLPAAVRARMRRLDEPARGVVQLLAVWGGPLSWSQLLGLTHRSAEAMRTAVADAVGADLLIEQDDLLRSRHDLVRQAVYNDLPASVRASLHRQCAEYVLATGQDALAAAPHMQAAAQLGDLGAVDVLRRAAEQSVLSLPDTAATLIKQAFALVPAGHPVWLAVGEQCAHILAVAQRSRESMDVVDVLLSRAVDDETRARLQVLAAQALWPAGALEELHRRVEDGLLDGVSEVTRLRLLAWRALASTRTGTAQAARSSARDVLDRAHGVADPVAEQVAVQALGEVARNELSHREALVRFRTLRTTAGARHLGSEVAELRLLDRFDEANRVLDEVRGDAAAGELANLPAVIEGRMWQHYMLGRLDDARAEAETLERVSAALVVPVAELEAAMTLMLTAVLRGDLSEAGRRLQAARRENSADGIVRLPRLTLVGSLLAGLAGDPARAVAMVRPVMDVAEQSGGYFPRLPEWMRIHAALGLAAGDREFAEQSVARAARAADHNPGVRSLRGIALQTRGVVDGDADLLDAAVQCFEDAPRPLLLAGALLDHGRALAAAGARGRAVEVLGRAYGLFEQAGARLASDLAADALRSTGDPAAARLAGRQRPTTGWAALTPAEVRVAELISRGYTNDSAARRLGVSPNTVATHLRAVFNKLDVGSRVQLANRWHARGAGDEVR